jgi:hypothetical protein
MLTLDDYIQVWRLILTQGLEWSHDRADEWISQSPLTRHLRDPLDDIYHDLPQYWMTSHIVERFAPAGIDRAARRAFERDVRTYTAGLDFLNFSDWPGFRQRLAEMAPTSEARPVETRPIVSLAPRRRGKALPRVS